MRIRRPALAALAAACLSLPLGAPSAAAATDTQGPQVLDIQITPATVTLTGMGTQVVTFKVHLTDQTGVCTTCRYVPDPDNQPYGFATPFLSLSGPPGVNAVLNVLQLGLTLVSGTVQDGWWATTRVVTGLWAGTGQAIQVVAEDTAPVTPYHGNITNVDPRTLGLTRQLAVTATDVPHISAGYDPAAIASDQSAFTIKGRAYLSTSGAAVGNLTLWYCEDNFCGIDALDSAGSVKTNAAGYYALTNLHGRMVRGLFLGATGQWETSPLYAVRWGMDGPPSSPRSYILTATVGTTPIPLGSSTQVNGNTNALLNFPPTVYLQRLVSGVWRTQTSAHIRASGRFTLIATPPTRGNHRYRVLRPAYDNYLTATTPIMLLGVY